MSTGAITRLPLGRRTRQGVVRWYVAQAAEGRERHACELLRSLVASDLLVDSFVPYKERWYTRNGSWVLRRVPMYAGYVFVVTPNATLLSREMARLALPVRLVGEVGRGYQPVSEAYQSWFERSMDADGVIRASFGEIVGGTLHVRRGPLVGQEPRVRKVDRHHRRCTVSVYDEQGGFSEQVALEVPTKR